MRRLILGMLMALALVGCAQVDSGTVGVKTRFSKVVGEPLEPGLHGINPFIEHIHEMKTQTVAYVVTATAVSKDMQEVTTQVTVNYSMVPTFGNEVYTKYRRTFEETVLAPTVQEAIKTVTAQFNVEDLVNQRPKVKEFVFNTTKERVAPTHLVEAVMLTDFAFSDDFTNAIEAKVTATQKAMEEKNKLESAKYQAGQRIEQARGEAEAIRIQAEAIKSTGGAEYIQLKWIEKWNGTVPSVQAGSGTSNMLMLNLNK